LHALVTGGGSGIGAASASRFAAAGYHVHVVDRARHAAEETVSRIHEGGGSAEAHAVDVASETAMTALGEHLDAISAPLSAVHINASIMVPGGNALEIELDHWDRTFAVNVRGALLTARMVLRHMIDRSLAGALCFTGSDTALRTPPDYPAYLCSKHAVIGLARSIAVDFGRHGIRSNIVTPGVTDTEGLRALYSTGGRDPESVIQQQANLSPLARIARPEDIAEAVYYLCSSQSPHVTGANLVVDGGMTVR